MQALAAYKPVLIFGGLYSCLCAFHIPNQQTQPNIKNAEALHGIVNKLYRRGQISRSSECLWGKASTIIPEVDTLINRRTMSHKAISHLERDDCAEFNLP